MQASPGSGLASPRLASLFPACATESASTVAFSCEGIVKRLLAFSEETPGNRRRAIGRSMRRTARASLSTHAARLSRATAGATRASGRVHRSLVVLSCASSSRRPQGWNWRSAPHFPQTPWLCSSNSQRWMHADGEALSDVASLARRKRRAPLGIVAFDLITACETRCHRPARRADAGDSWRERRLARTACPRR